MYNIVLHLFFSLLFREIPQLKLSNPWNNDVLQKNHLC